MHIHKAHSVIVYWLWILYMTKIPWMFNVFNDKCCMYECMTYIYVISSRFCLTKGKGIKLNFISTLRNCGVKQYLLPTIINNLLLSILPRQIWRKRLYETGKDSFFFPMKKWIWPTSQAIINHKALVFKSEMHFDLLYDLVLTSRMWIHSTLDQCCITALTLTGVAA